MPDNSPVANGSPGQPRRLFAEALLIPDTTAATLAGVSRATWHRLRSAGKLPAPVKLGHAVRWRREEVVAWIEAGCPDAKTWQAMRAAAERRTMSVVS